MSKSHIHQIRIKPHSDEWHAWRYLNGMGGSEISSVVATKSKTIAELTYTPPVKYFLGKIGEPINQFTGNVESESGHYFEPIILQWLKYYDLDNSGDLRLSQIEMFRKIKENQRVNKVISPKVFIKNDKYPWLFYSPDAWHWKNMTGKKRLAECKNTTSMAARRYVNNVDPAYYLQVQQGLLLSELECADLCILIDGRWFSVITVEPNKEIHDIIIEASHEMWQKILKAREIKKEYELPSYFGVNPEFLTEKQKEGVHILSDLEPDITGTDDEVKFFREMIVPSEDDNPMQGTEGQRKLCEQYNLSKDEENDAKIKNKTIYIELIKSLEGHNKAEFEDGTYYSYKSDKNGKRSIYVSPKIIASDAINN